MVARVRREYLPTVRTSSLSIGRPNSLGVSALSARNIWIPRVLNEVYYGICLSGIAIRNFLSVCVNFATYSVDSILLYLFPSVQIRIWVFL